jgi:CheY-like chemotaxis protein
VILADKYKYRVLVADDDQDVREIFGAVLACDLPDCRVDMVVNGAEVVDAFRSVHYGVVVMDVNMPVMGGEQAFNDIQKICAEENIKMPCFIFCTGYDPPPALKQIVATNPRHCLLRKPVDPDVFVQALKNRLGL